ncbi:MAG: nitroreductase family protein [Collinsella sp.]
MSAWPVSSPRFVERTGKAPRRAPGLGDFAIAAQDAVIAAQNAVVAAAEALGLGSCYIGDIIKNAEEVAALLDLPPSASCRYQNVHHRHSQKGSVRPLRIPW